MHLNLLTKVWQEAWSLCDRARWCFQDSKSGLISLWNIKCTLSAAAWHCKCLVEVPTAVQNRDKSVDNTVWVVIKLSLHGEVHGQAISLLCTSKFCSNDLCFRTAHG